MRQKFFQGLLAYALVGTWLQPAQADDSSTEQAGSNLIPPDLVLLQDGGMVRGTIIESVVGKYVNIRLLDGQTRHFRWDEVKYAGPKDGQKQLVQPALFVGSTPNPPPKPPRPETQWQLDLRVQLGLSKSGSDFAMPWGVNVAFGQWFARQRWYLGGIAGFGQVVSLNLDTVDAMGNPVNTDPLWANFGVEARRFLAHGTGSVRENGGPPETVGVRYWVGLATGVETFGLGNSNGGWGSLELGFDVGGGFPFGGIFSVGGGVDAAPVCPGAKLWRVDGAFNWRFYFNL